MAYNFETSWTREIASVSELPEFQKATIRLVDPTLLTKRDYNIDTGTWDVEGSGVVYEGRARIIGTRWGVTSGGESQSNTTTVKSILFQVPFGDASFRVKKGVKVFVTSSPGNPVLGDFIFTITSDMQGSSAASRTFEAALDGDVRKAI